MQFAYMLDFAIKKAIPGYRIAIKRGNRKQLLFTTIL